MIKKYDGAQIFFSQFDCTNNFFFLYIRFVSLIYNYICIPECFNANTIHQLF